MVPYFLNFDPQLFYMIPKIDICAFFYSSEGGQMTSISDSQGKTIVLFITFDERDSIKVQLSKT